MAFSNRMSLHQITTAPRPIDEVIEAAARAGIAGMGVAKDQMTAFGMEKGKKLLRDSGMRASVYSSVRLGPDPAGRTTTADENLRDLDDAAEIGVETVTVSTGGMGADVDMVSARKRFAARLAELAPLGAQRNLKLVLEPVHPVFATKYGILNSLRQTIDLIESIGAPECVGLLVDAYHVWWDPELLTQLERARDRIYLVQLNDWDFEIVTSERPYRRLPGEGCVDFDALMSGLKGYKGWYDIEATNDELRTMPINELIDRVGKSFDAVIAPRIA